jgi:hypothetical protein
MVRMTQQIKTGDAPLHFGGKPLPGKTIGQFWAWSSSDLLNNTVRGVFGEYIVASALGIDLKEPRRDWDTYDLLYPCNNRKIKIEVKTSAYLQNWNLESNPIKI